MAGLKAVTSALLFCAAACAARPPAPVVAGPPSVTSARRAARGDAFARQRALGPYAVSFALYLNEIHKRVHPLFTDRFLMSLDKLPPDDPRNAPKLMATLELAVAPDGHIAQMGLVRSSGVPAFDASGLEAFARAAPFEPTPEQIRSADGNLWVDWELHRDEVYACSTMNARPFLFGP